MPDRRLPWRGRRGARRDVPPASPQGDAALAPGRSSKRIPSTAACQREVTSLRSRVRQLVVPIVRTFGRFDLSRLRSDRRKILNSCSLLGYCGGSRERASVTDHLARPAARIGGLVEAPSRSEGSSRLGALPPSDRSGRRSLGAGRTARRSRPIGRSHRRTRSQSPSALLPPHLGLGAGKDRQRGERSLAPYWRLRFHASSSNDGMDEPYKREDEARPRGHGGGCSIGSDCRLSFVCTGGRL
jgi:hypothetical protein